MENARTLISNTDVAVRHGEGTEKRAQTRKDKTGSEFPSSRTFNSTAEPERTLCSESSWSSRENTYRLTLIVLPLVSVCSPGDRMKNEIETPGARQRQTT